MKKWIQNLPKLNYFFNLMYERTVSSIAFLPFIIGIGFFLLTGLLIFLEQHGMTYKLADNFPSFVIIKDWDIAKSILTTLIGALISLMVFSFSQVMVLLNNAASNFSPRIIPSLIAKKLHQIILGTYFGTIIMSLILVVNMTPSQPDIPLPSISVLIAITFGIICLMMFIFFIHSVSTSVQVQRIMLSIYEATSWLMKSGELYKLGTVAAPQQTSDWQIINSDRSGYLRSIAYQELHEICVRYDLYVKVLVYKSDFTLEGTPLLSVSNKIEEDMAEQLLGKLIFSEKELASNDHVIGVKQLTEIAVRAMSPGINDPGTAMAAIDYITLLLREKMRSAEEGAVLHHEPGKKNLEVRVWLKIMPFEDLLKMTVLSIRQYSRNDNLVLLKLLKMLKLLYHHKESTFDQKHAVKKQVYILMADAQKYQTNEFDLKEIEDFIHSF